MRWNRTKWSRTKWYIHILGLFVARCTVWNLCPLGAAFFIAADVTGMSSVLLFAEIMLGTTMMLSYVEAVKYGAIILVTAFVGRLMTGLKNPPKTPVMATVGALATMGLSMTQLLWQPQVMFYMQTAFLEGLLVFAAVFVFDTGIAYLKKSRKLMEQEEAVGIAFLIFTAFLGIPDLRVPYFSLLVFLVVLAVMGIAYRYGIREGGMLGVVLGGVLAFRYENLAYIGIIAILGIGTSLLRMFGKIGVLAAFGASAAAIWSCYPGIGNVQAAYGAVLAASLVFLFLPKSLLYPLVETISGQKTLLVEDAVWISTKNQLREFSDAFKRLKGTLEQAPALEAMAQVQADDRVLEMVIGQHCRLCDKCDFCWEQETGRAYEECRRIFHAMNAEQTLWPKHIPTAFEVRCVDVQGFLSEARHGFELIRLEDLWNRRMLEGREAIAGQLGEVSRILDDFSLELCEEVPVTEALESSVIETMKKWNVKVQKLAVLKNKQGREDIYITAKSTKGRMMTTREAAAVLGKVFNRRLRVQDGNKIIIGKNEQAYSFVEEPDFYYLQGLAKSTKEEEDISGDNFSILPLPQGQIVLMLADGMGSGEIASRESGRMVEMLERMLEAGFSSHSAIKLLNSVLAVPMDDPIFSTLDMTIVDLYTGDCEMAKIGASTTFIRHGNQVEAISATTFPMGVFPQMEFESSQRTLGDDDLLVMVSDGVLEACPAEDKEAYLKEQILAAESLNPQEIADQLMEVLTPDQKDDRTILVLGIWKY